jgi:hypothetical protein
MKSQLLCAVRTPRPFSRCATAAVALAATTACFGPPESEPEPEPEPCDLVAETDIQAVANFPLQARLFSSFDLPSDAVTVTTEDDLPAGQSFDGPTLVGTPTETGTFTFTAKARADALDDCTAASLDHEFTLTVVAPECTSSEDCYAIAVSSQPCTSSASCGGAKCVPVRQDEGLCVDDGFVVCGNNAAEHQFTSVEGDTFSTCSIASG